MDLLTETLERLKVLYKDTGRSPGRLARVGLMPKWTAVIGTDEQCGITLNFTEHQHIFGEPYVDIAKLRSFVGADLFAVADHFVRSRSLQERAIATSTVSALSQPLMTPAELEKRGYQELNPRVIFSDLLAPDDIAAMIGYGGTYLNTVPGKCREFHVTDIRPKKDFQTMIVDSDIHYVPDNMIIHGDEDNHEVLSAATAVLITGSCLVNGTLDELLSYTGKARIVDVWGPSASVIPDVLFERGVNYLETYRISDHRAFEEGVIKNNWDLKNVLPKTQTIITITRQAKSS